jgi:hypothetical protein
MRQGIPAIAILLLLSVLLGSCATSRYGRGAPAPPSSAGGMVKDNKPSFWTESNARVMEFRRHYAKTSTVETALRRSQSLMPHIVPELKKRRLPLQLAYLPMLESMFDPRADSGHARGLWQFIPSTAEQMGLKVGIMGDDRLNVRKSSAAAAEYLDQLGEMFNYNWALALAAYNCGPGCVRDAMKRQRSWDFWELRLRPETYEYVPRFLAMLQVAQQKYPHLMSLAAAEGAAGAEEAGRLAEIPGEQPLPESLSAQSGERLL